MASVMNSFSYILLQLLKVSLGNTNTCSLPSEINWQEVMNLAECQGVLAVAFDSIESLPANSRPDIDILMDWLGQTSYMETLYEQYVNAIHRLSAIVNEQELRLLLLKGYGCSLNYPKPNRRPCGDIDIFVMNNRGEHNETYLNFIEQILVSSNKVEVSLKNSHHSQFQFGGFTVENHATVLDTSNYKSSRYLNSVLEELAKESVQNMDSLTGACIPTASFNSIHLLRHMASDFATAKSTLRNVLDWSTFVKKHNVDWDYVQIVAYKTNMHRFLDAINSICIDYLDYPSDLFPVVEQDNRLRDRVLADILYPEFQDEIPTMSNKLAYGWIKTKRMWQNRWKYRIVFSDSMIMSFLSHVANRIKA